MVQSMKITADIIQVYDSEVWVMRDLLLTLEPFDDDGCMVVENLWESGRLGEILENKEGEEGKA